MWAEKERIEEEIPFIVEHVSAPGRLELSLIDDFDQLKGDEKILSIARRAKKAEIRYLIEASYSGKTNRTTADELSVILNQAYQSSLYKPGELFTGEIIFEEDGEYVFRD
ncbi:MAG: hypothetical protein AABY22_25980 [Nanoarchaeota archaeon]